MFLQILFSFLLQFAITVGSMVVFGLLIALCNRRFYGNFGSKSNFVIYATGFIGTPIHECSHALMCILFGHRITAIKLFQISDADGTLGYVEHSYNRRNIYQNIGNFFIGIAPMIVMSALLYLIAHFAIPSTLTAMEAYATAISFDSFSAFINPILGIFKAFFTAATTWQWWVFVLAGSFLALHITLSGADIKGALSGFSLLLIVWIIVDISLGFAAPDSLIEFNNFMFSAGSALTMFLLIALLITLIMLVVSYLYRFTIGRIIR